MRRLEKSKAFIRGRLKKHGVVSYAEMKAHVGYSVHKGGKESELKKFVNSLHESDEVVTLKLQNMAGVKGKASQHIVNTEIADIMFAAFAPKTRRAHPDSSFIKAVRALVRNKRKPTRLNILHAGTRALQNLDELQIVNYKKRPKGLDPNVLRYKPMSLARLERALKAIDRVIALQKH